MYLLFYCSSTFIMLGWSLDRRLPRRAVLRYYVPVTKHTALCESISQLEIIVSRIAIYGIVRRFGSEHEQNLVYTVDPVGVALVLHVQRQVLLALCAPKNATNTDPHTDQQVISETRPTKTTQGHLNLVGGTPTPGPDARAKIHRQRCKAVESRRIVPNPLHMRRLDRYGVLPCTIRPTVLKSPPFSLSSWAIRSRVDAPIWKQTSAMHMSMFCSVASPASSRFKKWSFSKISSISSPSA